MKKMTNVSKTFSRPGSAAGIPVMLAATFLLVASSMPARAADGGEARQFFDPIEVEVVNVDVYVTDANGQAVPGLTLADFEVLEDGRQVEITYFTASLPSQHDPAREATPEPVVQQDQELSLVVLFDERGIASRQRRTTIDSLRSFLTMELPATLRSMLVTSDDGLTVRAPLTNDPSRLVAALDEMARNSRPRLDIERDRILRDIQNAAGAVGTDGIGQSLASGPLTEASTGGGQFKRKIEIEIVELEREARRTIHAIRAYAMSQSQRTDRLLGELETLVRSLSVIPGRKAILLVGDGLKSRPGEGMFLAWEQAFPEIARQMNVTSANEARKHDVSPRIQRVAGSASRNRVSFYTLNVPFRATSGIYAEGPGTAGGRDRALVMADQSALAVIARATGGRSLRISPGLAGRLGDVVHEMGTGYSLGYSPDHPAGGQVHSLTVRVRGEDFDVRHREGYLHALSTDRIADRTLAAAVLGVADNQLGVSVEVQEVGPPQADGSTLVPVLVKVPMARLMLRPEGERHTGQITAVVVCRGADGLSEPQSWSYPINVANDQMMDALGTQAGLVLHLALGSGPQRIAVGVRDDVAGAEATTALEINIPPPSSEGEQDGET